MNDQFEFLLQAGRTLAQMALYTADHPAVKDLISNAHHQLTTLLGDTNEIVISQHEGKLLLNGKPQENLGDGAVRPFLQLLDLYSLHSLSFFRGVSMSDLTAFFQLAFRPGETKKKAFDVGGYFSGHGIQSIKVNQAKYARIGENEAVGQIGQPGDGAAAALGVMAGLGDNTFLSKLESLNLNDILKALIEKSVVSNDDRARVWQLVTGHIQREMETAVRRATESLQKENVKVTNERVRVEGVVEAMADGVVVVDESGNVLMMNPAAELMYGVTLGERLGKPLWEGVREEQMMALAKDITVPTDRPLVKEVQLKAAQETKRTLRASTATVQDTEGRVVGVVSVLSDVTRQRELNRLQNEFMANVTHDLRTPIHALKLAVSAILEGSAGPVSQEQEKMLSLANRNVERLSRLIDDLLDFSQIETGSLKINPQLIPIAPLLKEAVQGLESWAKNRHVSLVFEESGSLPPVYADNDRVLQVVINLLSNAIKFSGDGGRVVLRAKPVLVKDKPFVEIQIEDNGKGISKDDQKRIFDRFVQLANKEKLDIRGTGLGLSICKALVDLHKGALSIESPPPGKPTGSVFSFTLPVMEKKTEAPTPNLVEPVSIASPIKKSFWKKFLSRFQIFFVITLAGLAAIHARPNQGAVRRVLAPNLLQLNDGATVRLLGVDTPVPGDAFYEEAYALTFDLTNNQSAVFEYGVDERTRDGDWQAYAYVDGIFVNEELVRAGLATVARLANETTLLKDLVRAEIEARRARRGIWKAALQTPATSKVSPPQTPDPSEAP